MPRAALQLHLVEPGLAELVLADPDLTLPAKLTLLYVLNHAEQIHTRQELAAVNDLVSDHLDEVLHELVGRNWLATVPPDMLPCLASRFQLRQDHEDQDEDVDGSILNGVAGGGAAATEPPSSTWAPG
jgi:hypothetical protein